MTAFEIGYKKPPLHSRFKKKQSGNPRGRPRKQRPALPQQRGEDGFREIFLQEAHREVNIREGDQIVKSTVARTAARNLSVAAAKGDPRALRKFMEYLKLYERENRAEADNMMQLAHGYKMRATEELARRKSLGITAPVLPHPDHVVFNPLTKQVEIQGPATEKQKVLWDTTHASMAECDEDIRECGKLLKEDPTQLHLQRVIDDALRRKASFVQFLQDRFGVTPEAIP